MNPARMLAVAALALASLPLLAQQPASTDQQTGAPAAQVSPTPTTTAAASELSPVNGELVEKLDTKTAKTGDPVVIKTRSNVTMANGTEIPKGSKLVGRVMAVKPLGQGNPNSQVAVQFDHAELKGGQSLPIHAEIQELSSSDSIASDTMAATPSPSPSTGATPPGGAMNGSNAAGTGSMASPPQPQPRMSNSSPTAAGSGAPAPGTIVARTGNIAIRTTSIPGVLLASNQPGQQDPRMAQSSGILLGPQHDIHLDGGTRVVVGVSVTSTNNPGGD